MSWGRIDDGFTTHRKVLALRTPTRRWTWLEVLTYTWRHRSAVIPDEIGSVIKGATVAFLDDCERIGLLERDPHGERVVHDWPLYSDATIRVKVAYFLDRNPGASANEVARATGGTRDLVLAEVRLYHSATGTESGSAEPVSEPPTPVRPNRQSGTESGSRARAPLPTQGLGLSSYAPLATPGKNGHGKTGFEKPYFARLHEACGGSADALEKLRRAARGKSDARVVVAYEACTGPGVRDPLAVALATLAKPDEEAPADDEPELEDEP